MKALLIARVSTDDQIDALPAQKYRLEDYAKRQGYAYEIVEFQESAYKGDRDQFRAIVKRIKVSKEQLIVVFDKVDRFSRDTNSELVREIQDMCKIGKIELHFPSDNLFLNSNAPAVSNMQLNMSLSFSQYYSDAVSDNVKRRLQQKWRDGEWSGKAPFGYINYDKADRRKWIKPHETDAQVVRDMYEWYCSGVESMLTIKRKLRDHHGVGMNKSQIARILNNPFYYGQMEIKGKLYPHKYEKLVTEHQFDTAKHIRSGYKVSEVGRRRWSGLPYKYRGLITCADCGCRITFEMKKKKYLYGHCTQMRGKHRAAYVPEDKITSQFAHVFSSISISDDAYNEACATLRAEYESIEKSQQEQLATLHAESARYTRRIERIYDDLLDDKIDEKLYQRKRAEFEKKVENSQKAIRTFELNSVNDLASITYLLELAKDAPELFKHGNIEQKRKLIKTVYSNLQLKDKLLRWKLKKPFELMAFCAENRDWQGLYNLFQTFEDLDKVKDKPADIQAVREVLDGEEEAGK